MSHTYESGATRGEVEPRYRDVPHELIERIAKAFAYGAEKYEQGLPPYEKNWEKGDLTFALDAIDHLIKHVLKYKEMVHDQLNGRVFIDDEAEDHLGHAGANLAMLARFEAWGYWEPKVNADIIDHDAINAPIDNAIYTPTAFDETAEDELSNALIEGQWIENAQAAPSAADRIGSLLRSLVGKG